MWNWSASNGIYVVGFNKEKDFSEYCKTQFLTEIKIVKH